MTDSSPDTAAEPLVKLTIPGQPVPKGRPRAVWPKGSRRPAIFTPTKTRAAEARIAQYFWVAYPRLAPLAGRLRLVVRFYCSDKRRRDQDNLTKTVMDALNKRAYKDDSQIESVHADVVRGDSNPRTELELWAY